MNRQTIDKLKNPEITFNKLEMADLDLLYKWYHTDFVNQWYDKENPDWTRQQIEEKYIPYVRGEKPLDSYIILCGGVKMGYVQVYLLEDYPEYDELVQAGEGAAGVDLFIGERDYLHKGLGPVIIRELLKNIVFKDDAVTKCIIGPEPKNTAAIKAYGKAGFKYIKTIQVPEEEEPEYIMEIRREEIV
ncbi:GNAT family N-acetyltransferase [Breznakiella homolactica]|uniref:Acetyltransferase n=1 Tax=Breznakiella homolactica TaxID=2798577 RepID=A0A7T7XJL8_9SPIR|nr:GNAT family N-acetyltransferase [Breznakiella homolactica]QQO07634.1 acetyltransferase [Breznakiella homolactica]